MNWVKKYYHTGIIILVSGLVLFSCLWAVLQAGFPANHDRNLYMNWLYEFDLGIRGGNLQPRWAPDAWVGYGVPIFNFIQPGFYYLAEIFHLVGFSLLHSVKIVIVLSVILGYASMFLLSRQFWKNSWAALASAVLYTWSPYHLGSLYLRGSYAELLAMGLWPLLLFSLIRFIKTGALKYFCTVTIITGALLITNNALAVMFLPIVVTYVLITAWRQWRKIFTILAAIIIGGGMGAFFWLPAIVEMGQTNFSLYFSDTLDYANNFLNLKQLIVGNWQEYIFLIGLTGLAIIAVTIYTVLEQPATRKTYGNVLWWWLGVFFLAAFMSSHHSKFIWDRISLLRDFQFPWRWLALANLSVGLLSGILVVYKKSVRRYSAPAVLSIILIVITLVTNSSFAFPESVLPPLTDENYRPFREREIEIKKILQEKQSNTVVYFFSEIPNIFSTTVNVENLHERMSEVLAKYKAEALVKPDAAIKFPDKLEILSGEATLIASTIEAEHYTAQVDVKSETVLRVNTLWFPGWRVTVDGQEYEPTITEDLGIMDVALATGLHDVDIKFGLTPIRLIGRIITITSIVILLLLAIFWKRLYILAGTRYKRTIL